MPDWTYHPIWRPLMFRLPGEDARRLTIGYLDLQGRTRIGRELFRLLSYGFPQADEGVELLGLRFRSRVGVGAGLDLEGRAGPVLQYLGSGFVLVGPTTVEGQPRDRTFDRGRIREQSAISWSDRGYLPSAAVVTACLQRRKPAVKVPIGIVVEGSDLPGIVARLADMADFLAVPDVTEFAPDLAASIRSASTKPMLSRIGPTATVEDMVARARGARDLGYDGVVLGIGERYSGVVDGWISGPASLPVLEASIRAVRADLGGDLPIVAAGGAVTPRDVVGCLEAGADLVEVSAGFVYSGPGIVARSLRLRHGSDTAPNLLVPRIWSAPRLRWLPVAIVLLVLGLLALPAHLLGQLPDWLVVDTTVRNAQAAGVASLGALLTYCLALARRGEAWAWWPALAAGGMTGLASGVAGAAGILVVAATAGRELMVGFRALFDRGLPAWRWSPANLGRRCIQAAALALAALALGSGGSASLRLLVAGSAVLVTLMVGRGLVPGVRPTFLSLVAWSVSFVPAVVMLPRHSAAAFVAIALAASVIGAGLSWLYRPLFVTDEMAPAFPDV